MVTPYDVLKASLDPVVFLLLLLAFGFLVSFKIRKKSSGHIVLLIAFLFF